MKIWIFVSNIIPVLVVIFVGHVRILSTDAYMHLQVVILIAHPIIPSGKHTKNYGQSSFLIGTSTISMAIFNAYVSLPGCNSHESTLALIFGK